MYGATHNVHQEFIALIPQRWAIGSNMRSTGNPEQLVARRSPCCRTVLKKHCFISAEMRSPEPLPDLQVCPPALCRLQRMFEATQESISVASHSKKLSLSVTE